MEVILLERVAKLGQMGETVKVRDGFARNFLLPRGKALRATKTNKERFETQRAQLEARNLERRKEAETVGEKLDGQSFVIIRQAGETGVLYGSVSTRDLAETLTAGRLLRRPRPDRAQRSRSRRSACTSFPVVLHPEVEVHGDRSTSPAAPRKPSARRAARRSPSARRRTSTISASRSARRSRRPAATRRSRPRMVSRPGKIRPRPFGPSTQADRMPFLAAGRRPLNAV